MLKIEHVNIVTDTCTIYYCCIQLYCAKLHCIMQCLFIFNDCHSYFHGYGYVWKTVKPLPGGYLQDEDIILLKYVFILVNISKKYAGENTHFAGFS